ncbi:right-handed parallel beta-helix repeat-containing protein [Acinetobacter pseudolwoffii]|uniref:right-handed parallel beta-helix repeat-containing protein n=1 Tax=Acinetobacter pseudolwoffii TaxID=2053287 RepID=UPI0021E379BB|nr:right-handed parallel beta-helix repeat-containing protein [Acinetobacter pseudolwoffii]
MAVPEQTPYKEYTGNGVTKSFSLGFICKKKEHLIVKINDTEVPANEWSLTAETVIFNIAPGPNEKISLQRKTPNRRTTSYQSFNSSFNPAAINEDLDTVWLRLQEEEVTKFLLNQIISKNYIDLTEKDQEVRSELLNQIIAQGISQQQIDAYAKNLLLNIGTISAKKGWLSSLVALPDGNNLDFFLEQQAITAFDVVRVIDVGPGSRYLTLSSAIEYASKLKPKFVNSNLKIKIQLKSGFVMREQIFVYSQDLSYIIIDSDDAVVPVQRSAITSAPTSEIYKPLFFGNQCATLPIIDCLFEFDSSGAASGQSGVWVETGSKVVMGPSGAGVKGSPGRGLHVSNGSIGYARATIWDNSGLGLRVSNGSICQFRNASAQNCTNSAACEGSVLNLTNANFSGAIEQGVTTDGCEVFGWGVKAQNCGGVGYYPSGGTHDIKQGNFSGCASDGIRALNMAVVNFLEGTASGCGQDGIRATDGANVSARSADVSNSGRFGIEATGACIVAARGANASNCNNGAFLSARGSFIDATEANGTHPTNNAFTVANGGIIAANGATGRLAQKGNIMLGSGVIFSDRVMSVTAAFVEKVFTPGEIYEQTITFTGIETSDQIAASINRNLQGCNMWSYVSAANTVKVFIKNEAAASVTVNAGTITVKIV